MLSLGKDSNDIRKRKEKKNTPLNLLMISIFPFQTNVRERLLPVQPEGHAPRQMDGTGELGRRPLHPHVGRLVLRRPPL